MGHQAGKKSSPKHGSKGVWPRKRAKSARARVRTAYGNGALLFAGYKAGMTHITAIDNRKTSPTKGQRIVMPATVIEAPDIKVFGVRFYKRGPKGDQSIGQLFSENLDKNLGKKIKLPKKKEGKSEEKIGLKPESWPEFDHIHLLCHTVPPFKKTPEIFEMPLGGTSDEQKNFATEHLGKDIKYSEVIAIGDQIDIIAVTKAKGFQGPVKRFGVRLLQHKSAKKRRKAGTLGPWNPNIITPHTPMPGQMGFHQRVEINKWVLASGEGKDINPKGDFPHYGKVKANYLLVSGSIPGQKKRLVFIRKAIRPNKAIPKQVPDIEYISKEAKQ